MIVKLLTEHHLEFLSLKGGCRGSSESTLVKMSNCWKSHAAAQMAILFSKCIASTAMRGGFLFGWGSIFGRSSDRIGFEDFSSPDLHTSSYGAIDEHQTQKCKRSLHYKL